MLTPEQVKDAMHHYTLTQTIIALAGGVSDADLSSWLRGRKEFPPHVLTAIEHGLAALENIVHAGFPFPLDFRSPNMVPLIKEYTARHEAYLREKAAAGE